MGCQVNVAMIQTFCDLYQKTRKKSIKIIIAYFYFTRLNSKRITPLNFKKSFDLGFYEFLAMLEGKIRKGLLF